MGMVPWSMIAHLICRSRKALSPLTDERMAKYLVSVNA